MNFQHYRLLCYGKPYADIASFFIEARQYAELHIQRDCPHGSMAWATDIRWSFAQHAGPHGSWVSVANSESLDHQMQEVWG